MVDPPIEATDTMALYRASRVRMCDGRTSRAKTSRATSPTRSAAACFSAATAGMSPTPKGARPMKSATPPMVLAVYWAAQVPAPGQALRARSSTSSWPRRPTARSPRASHMSWIVTSRSRQRPGIMLPL